MHPGSPKEIQFSLADYLKPGSHKVYFSKGENAKKAQSVPELVQETNDFSTKNRPGCRATLTASKPKELFLEYNVKCDLHTSSPEGHTVRIRFDTPQVADGTRATDLDVKVSCQCKAFLYWGGQFNAYQRDALEGEPRPELAPPTERLDLRGKFIICKHVATVCERILPSVQHNINNINRRFKLDKKKQEESGTKPSRLEEKAEAMRQRFKMRQEKERKRKLLEKKLQQKVRSEKDHVVTRDTPSTPKEKLKLPKLKQPVGPAPKLRKPTTPDLSDESPVAPPPSPTAPPRQEAVTPDTIDRTEEATTSKALPQKLRKPQKRDLQQLDDMLAEEEAKQTEGDL